MIARDHLCVLRADFFFGDEVYPAPESYATLRKRFKKMFVDKRVREQEKSRSLGKTIHYNPLVAWAKQNDVSLKGVGDLK
jgi:hypothetical protein